MNNINRIKEVITKIESNNFVIKEQTVIGDLWDIGAGAVGGLWDGLKSGVSDGVPYLVDKITNSKLITPQPFSGNLVTVVDSAAKLFINSIKGFAESKTDVYNLIIILDNLIEGAKQGKIVDGDGDDFKVWEVLEAFTYSLYSNFRNKSFNPSDMWDLIDENDIDDAVDFVVDEIETRISYNATIGNEAEEIKDFLVDDFFESGKSFTAFYNTDRLDGEWEVGQVKVLLNRINLSDYQEDERMKSPFESKLESVLPCYETAKFSFVKMNNSEQINGAIKVQKNWTFILFFRDDTLTLNVYHNGTNKPPVAKTKQISCNGGTNTGDRMDDVVGINESLLSEQARRDNYLFFGKVRFDFSPEDFTRMMNIYQEDKGITTTPEQPEQGDDEDVVTTTTTSPESSQSDSNKEEVPAGSGTPNTDKLIKLLIEKGVQEIVANNPKHRASMGSVSVGALINKVVTQEEYTKNEESMYAAKFIESIEKGYTKFNTSGKTNHEEKAKKEEKVITTTANISNPTPLELNKIEEIGDDARAKTSNELSFDKNRIKTVRITSDEKTVVYIAKEDITDIVSDIEGQLERVFGGDWKLDSAKNRFMSSNKVFIFSKKEE